MAIYHVILLKSLPPHWVCLCHSVAFIGDNRYRRKGGTKVAYWKESCMRPNDERVRATRMSWYGSFFLLLLPKADAQFVMYDPLAFKNRIAAWSLDMRALNIIKCTLDFNQYSRGITHIISFSSSMYSLWPQNIRVYLKESRGFSLFSPFICCDLFVCLYMDIILYKCLAIV